MFGRTLAHIFSEGGYTLLAAVSAIAAFVLYTWLPNLGLVWQIAGSNSIQFSDKIDILVALTGSIGTNFTIFSGAATIVTALLFGVNITALVYFLKARRMLGKMATMKIAATGFGGLASGILGTSCAACGPLLIGPVLAFMGFGVSTAFLPFGGEEFSIAGVLLLGLSLILTLRNIDRLIYCSYPAIRQHSGSSGSSAG